MLLAWLVLKSHCRRAVLPARWPWCLGLCIIGIEALRTIGAHGIRGDLLFVVGRGFFATFGMLVRLWRVPAMRAVAMTSVLSLVGLPSCCYDSTICWLRGYLKNVLQAVVQGEFAGAGAIYLFARAVVLLGASRAVLFPSLVPPFTLLIGFWRSAKCRACRSLSAWWSSSSAFG